MKKTLDIKSVCECNRRLGCKTLHPQASIINLEHPDLEQEARNAACPVKQFFARTRKAIEDWFYQTMPIAE